MTTSVSNGRDNPRASRHRERFNRDSHVMAAAVAVMSEKGYAATSIQEVADRVGVLKGSLYHYFNSKEELLYRILEESHEQVREIRAAVDALELPPLESLLEYLRQSSAWYLANLDRANIFFTETKNLSGERLEAAWEWGRSFERTVSDEVARGQDAGTIRSDIDQRLITRFILGTVNNVRSWPSRPSGKQFADQQIVDALIQLVRDAIAAR